ncbi:MBL fold metallo-hydrolase [Lentilactobacillus hilgardii]|uniref:Metallo-beta-lactamase domain protein n=1 Tax=Lentilactobacillus hilgardii (strain ATCC 8290 / DSM 20176 / CCUG 30140 / JCM 1155 / KCTC 3500 / NBRC 15886 / NCIMB 8040 / NRRL B-1843 / 9) TaxID=1423757 RepID=C0XKG8_LENH9|nr:metallo-beta-lactamase domain protein [Lentilactobacillus hilgardii DSM 20176 = ATCC 8290]KRK58023.1 metal-dependent hydrolase [Lentilactobacillus hilgardii DSM 20176 = ATCC 8290]QEU38191.1 MBL fold metallo-hydrolase [Lentilactobacillus hilgardii]
MGGIFLKLTVLGFLGGYPANGNGTSSYLLESGNFHFLIDCGSAALLSLEEILDPLKLDALILTHYHHDHTADVGVLQYYWQLHEKRYDQKCLPIYGHTLDKINFDGLSWPDSTKGVAYDPEKQLNVGPFSITFFKMHHPVPAFGLRITEKATGKVLVFTADTAYFPEIAYFARNADLLMTDTNFYADKTGTKWHMTSTESGQLAKDAEAKRLLLTHLPAYGDPNQLKQEAETTAGSDIPIDVASRHLTIQI